MIAMKQPPPIQCQPAAKDIHIDGAIPLQVAVAVDNRPTSPFLGRGGLVGLVVLSLIVLADDTRAAGRFAFAADPSDGQHYAVAFEPGPAVRGNCSRR